MINTRWEAKKISKVIDALWQAERAMCADWTKRIRSDHAVEAKISYLLERESSIYLAAIDAWQQEKMGTVIVQRDEDAWATLVKLIDENELWETHNILRQIEVSLIASIELSEQAKKNYPYSQEQLFLEALVHEKKKSRRKVNEVLRYVQNRIWEEIGFAPYTY